MTSEIFTFTHLIHRHDKHFCSIDPVVAMKIVYEAMNARIESKLSSEDWIKYEYDAWIAAWNPGIHPIKKKKA